MADDKIYIEDHYEQTLQLLPGLLLRHFHELKVYPYL